MLIERRSCVRHKVHGPLFASFDGITGGMILDLSEDGLSMQTAVPLEADQSLRLRLALNKNQADAEILETTGYVAWADALGRAGIRFSELPAEARRRLDQWLATNDEAPSRKAPKLTFDPTPVDPAPWPGINHLVTGIGRANPRSVSLEAESAVEVPEGQRPVSNTIQYEFHSLGSDLNSALRTISERARTLLRGGGAAIALIDPGALNSKGMMCRASVGSGGPPLGTLVDVKSGFSGECIRTSKALRCDDTETDSRVEVEACRRFGIRSLVAAPIRYDREVIGLLEVFSAQTFAFDEGDLGVLERLAQTAIIVVCQTQLSAGGWT
jgi:hypothetical protein